MITQARIRSTLAQLLPAAAAVGRAIHRDSRYEIRICPYSPKGKLDDKPVA